MAHLDLKNALEYAFDRPLEENEVNELYIALCNEYDSVNRTELYDCGTERVDVRTRRNDLRSSNDTAYINFSDQANAVRCDIRAPSVQILRTTTCIIYREHYVIAWNE